MAGKPIKWRTASAVIAKRVRELREGRSWSAQNLAERCEAIGAPQLNRSVLANIDSGRRESVSVDEWLVLALALDVAPVHLLVPLESTEGLKVGKWTVTANHAREWVRGTRPLPSQDVKRFRTEVPADEWAAYEQLIEEARSRGSTAEEIRAFFDTTDEIETEGD